MLNMWNLKGYKISVHSKGFEKYIEFSKKVCGFEVVREDTEIGIQRQRTVK